MAFGNPYGDLWTIDELVNAVDLLSDMQVEQISLADTVGLASPQEISDLVTPLMERFKHLEIGVHLHSRPEDAKDKIRAAYNAGCRRFDSAIGGLGGCPFAQDELVGNLPTEIVLETLNEIGAEPPIRKPLGNVIKMSQLLAAGSATVHIQ
jgi:hydroxymethylglutaryl-CoA lyase